MGEEVIRRKELVHLLVFAVSALIAVLRVGLADFEEKEVYISGRVAGDILREGRRTVTRIKIEKSEIEGIEGRKGVLVVYGFLPGEARRVSLIGDVKVTRGRVYIYARPEDIEIYPEEKSVRSFLMERYLKRSDHDHVKGVGLSFLFGEPREVISPDVQRSFLRTGLVHLLVISGLHIGTIAFVLSKMLPRFWGLKLALLGVLLYTLFVVPAEPPILRATLMITLIILAHLTFRRPNYLSILLASGTVILLVFPHYVFSYSFWLSFLATGYIILVLRDLEGGRVFRTLLVSSSAFTGVAPLVSTFSYVSPVSVLLTPLIAPVVVLYSFFGVASLITLMAFPPLVDLFDLTGRLFVGLVHFWEGLSFQIYPRVGLWEAVFLSLLGAFLLYFLRGGWKLAPVFLVNGWLTIRSI